MTVAAANFGYLQLAGNDSSLTPRCLQIRSHLTKRLIRR
jgi:hypothetical protein